MTGLAGGPQTARMAVRTMGWCVMQASLSLVVVVGSGPSAIGCVG